MQIPNGSEHIKNNKKSKKNANNNKIGINIEHSGKCFNKIIDEDSVRAMDTNIDPRGAVIEYRTSHKKKEVLSNSPIDIHKLTKCNIDNEIEFTLEDFMSENDDNISIDKQDKGKNNLKTYSRKTATPKKNHHHKNNSSLVSIISQLTATKKKHRKQHSKSQRSMDSNLANDYKQLQMINQMEMIKDLETIKQLKELEKVQQLINLEKVQQGQQHPRASFVSNSNSHKNISQPQHPIIPNQTQAQTQGQANQVNQSHYSTLQSQVQQQDYFPPNNVPQPIMHSHNPSWEYQQQQQQNQLLMSMLWQQQQFQLQMQYQYQQLLQMNLPYIHSNIQSQVQPYLIQQTSRENSTLSSFPITEPKYCSYCEEVYKYTILKNLPFKLITCLYCKTQMNQVTLDYFLMKYKDKLYDEYRSRIGSSKDNQSPSPIKTTHQQGQLMTSYSNSSLHDSITPPDERCSVSFSITQPKQLGEIDKKQLASASLLNVSNINNNTSISLAQAFKQRHLGLINKIEKRAYSVKDNSVNSSVDTIDINQQNSKQIKPKPKIVRNLNPIPKPQALSKNSNTNSKENIHTIQDYKNNKRQHSHEPSKELIDRLIHGKRAKMTQKEMRELNKRLCRNLCEVKLKHYDDQKNQSLIMLSEKKAEFTKSLKKSVVEAYKNKH